MKRGCHSTAAESPRDMRLLTNSSWRSWIWEWWAERKCWIPLWKRLSFHFGSDLGCCPSFFSCHLNKSEIAPSPSAGDDITKICSQNLYHFMSSSLYSHQLCQHQYQHPKFFPHRKPSRLAPQLGGKFADPFEKKGFTEGRVFFLAARRQGYRVTTPYATWLGNPLSSCLCAVFRL